MDKVKTLILDIETLPLEGYFWRLFDENIGINQMTGHGGMLSWAAAWAHKDYVEFASLEHHGKEDMVRHIWNLLDEADEVVGWNSDRFDIPHINTEFLRAGYGPPSPYKKVDLFKTVKQQFKLPSNKLDYFAQQMGIGKKVDHEGFPLWAACMKGDPEAWEKMRAYNIHDVEITEGAYKKLLPWITSGINRSAFADAHVCPNCDSTNLHSRGYHRTLSLVYRRYQCQDCGTWSRKVAAEKKSTRQERLVLAR
jgi:DNA polymerase elongation subunit (family B)